MQKRAVSKSFSIVAVHDGKDGAAAVTVECIPSILVVPTDSGGYNYDDYSGSFGITLRLAGRSVAITNVVFTSHPEGLSASYGNGRVTVRLTSSDSGDWEGVISFAVTGVLDDATYTGYGSISVVPNKQGEQGNPTPVYNIVCDPAVVNFRSNATGEFAPSLVNISASVRRMTPEGSTAVAPVNNLIDEKYYLYYYNEESETWNRATNGNAYLTYQVSVSDALQGVTTKVAYALSTSATASGVNSSNTVARIDVPVVCDGRIGQNGAMGKMFYPMGEWSSTVTYSRTGNLVPLVFLPDNEYNEALGVKGNYWYLKAESSTGERPADGNIWEKANSFGVVITQGVFAEFAKLGKGIFSGDYLFSMNGRIGSTDYAAGALYEDGLPAYIRFLSEDMQALLTGSGTMSLNNYYRPSRAILNVTLAAGESVDVEMTAYGGNNTYVSWFEQTEAQSTGASTMKMLVDGSATATSIATFGTVKTTHRMVFTAPRSGNYHLRIKNASGAAITYVTKPHDVFEPNWWVNLMTGKMSAARGNFVVGASGDVEVKGTVRAENLYHGVCIAFEEKWGYCTETFIETYETEPWITNFTAGKYYTVEEIVELSETHAGLGAGMLPCTYDADIVITSNNSNVYNDRIVYLPCAKDFEGKVVEVIDAAYGTVGDITVRAVDGGDFGAGLWYKTSGSAHSTVSRLDDHATVGTGTRQRFYSLYNDNKWWWLKIG